MKAYSRAKKMVKSVHIFIISLIVLSVAESRVISPDSDPHRSVHSPPNLAASNVSELFSYTILF